MARALSEGADRELAGSGPNEEIAPQARFELELPALSDVRVRLFDESEKAVPSKDRLEAFASKTRYVLVPDEPLITGSSYSLVIDGLKADYPSGPGGERFDIARIDLKTSGEKPEPAPPPKKLKPARRSGKKRS